MGNCNEPVFNSFGSSLERLFRREEKINFMNKKKRIATIFAQMENIHLIKDPLQLYKSHNTHTLTPKRRRNH